MIANLVEAMSPGELLFDATRLLHGGDVLPAAVMARAALDTHLRKRVALLGRSVKYTGIGPYCDVLRTFGAITSDQAKLLRQVARIGHRAAHNYAVISWDVEWMIQELRSVVEEV